MSLLLLSSSSARANPIVRTGIVRAEHKALRDDTGVFHPLGLTFFWALYGWKYERQRIHDHLAWLAPKGFDYLRILGEVDWTDRSIDPPVDAGNTTPAAWPDYREQLRGFVDYAYDVHGLRSEIIDHRRAATRQEHGRAALCPRPTLARVVCEALVGAEHKVMLYEMANEADRLDKASMTDLVQMAQVVEGLDAEPRVTVPAGRLRRDESGDRRGGRVELHAALAAERSRLRLVACAAGVRLQGLSARLLEQRTRRATELSGEEMSDPLQLACCRLLGVVCGGAGYVLHVGQGVTGEAEPDHDRPQDMWDVAEHRRDHGDGARRRSAAAARRRELEVCQQRPERSSAAARRASGLLGRHERRGRAGAGGEQKLCGDQRAGLRRDADRREECRRDGPCAGRNGDPRMPCGRL